MVIINIIYTVVAYVDYEYSYVLENIVASHLDNEFLIMEMQKRLALWDTASEDCKDKKNKIQA